VFRSEMGQNFYVAIIAWTSCFVLTVLISLATRRTKTDAELRGLVYSLTPRPSEAGEPWFRRPAVVGSIVLAVTLLLNFLFR
jgi:solute:Na+ symporter, SSS family